MKTKAKDFFKKIYKELERWGKAAAWAIRN